MKINYWKRKWPMKKNRTKSLEQQMECFKSTYTELLARLSDLSIVSKTGKVNSTIDAEQIRCTALTNDRWWPLGIFSQNHKRNSGGPAKNHRTEIVMLPKLDQFFELLEPPTTSIEIEGQEYDRFFLLKING